MRVLVTGGMGFIGSHLVQQLRERSEVEEIFILDNMTYAASENNFVTGSVLVRGDISDREITEQLITNVDICINVAAETHVDRSISDDDPFIHTNVVGVKNLLQLCLKYGVKFLQVSTDEVYGSIPEGLTDEDHPLQPRSPYAASKAAADMLIQSYVHTYGLDAGITRGCNTYGPRQYPEKLLPVAINNVLRGLKIPVYGDGTNIREWMYVTDHVKGILAVMDHMILMRGSDKNCVFNLGSGKRFSNLHVLALLTNIMGVSGDVFTFVEDRKGHDLRYALDARKAASMVDFRPQVDIANGLYETVNWYKNYGEIHWKKEN